MNETNKLYGIKNASNRWLCQDSENGDIFWSEYASHASFWNTKEGAEQQIKDWSRLQLSLRVVSGFFVED